MKWARRLRAQGLAPLVDAERAAYAAPTTPAAIAAWQLERFNGTWDRVRRRVPFWRDLHARGGAPDRFGSWAEVRATLPAIDRATARREGRALTDPSRPPDGSRATGGSTSEPLAIPVWREEAGRAAVDLWAARAEWGVRPDDRLFLVWGHAHLLGRGLRGRWNGLRRRASDRALGYRRHSAYDMSPDGLRRAGDALLAFRPAWVLAYAVALDRLAEANADRADAFRALGLTVAVATAEGFPRADSRARIEAVLGCPVAMEYGAVETGPVAHERPGGGYRAFWRRYRLEGIASAEVEGAWELLVTALDPRAFPLVRYRLGDLVSADPDAPGFDQTFERVVGRCNDVVELPGGRAVHSEAFTHAIRDLAGVAAFQVVQRGPAIDLAYTGPRALAADDESELRRRLATIDADLAGIAIRRVEALPATIAGKTRTIRREG